jgi:ABC-2 type transport system permease protein
MSANLISGGIMRNFFTIFKREFTAYFNTPTAYIYLIVFLLMNCGLFMWLFFLNKEANMRPFFGNMPFFLIVFVPAIAMRLWSEERKLGTLALLMSFPMPSRTLVAGKFAASLLFYFIALVGTAFVPVMLVLLGDPDLGSIIGGYLGSLLLGGLFLAVGMFISAFFKDQIVTLILSILICFSIFLMGTDFVTVYIDGWVNGLGALLGNSLGAAGHYSSFERGVIDLRGIFYFLSFTFILLMLNTYTLESKIKLKGGGRFAISVLFLLFIGVASNLVLSEMRLPRLDLTQGRVYTISDATVRIVSRLKAPVEVNYYVSPREKMPSAMRNIQQDVEDRLSDFARINKNFVYHIYNPLADPAKLKELEEKGVIPFQAQSLERDSLDIKRVYSAITISYLDKKTEVLPEIVPNSLGQLEYNLMSKIFRMTLTQKPSVAMIAPISEGDPRLRDPRMKEFLLKMGQKIPEPTDNYSSLMGALRDEGYAVSRIKLSGDEPIPPETKTALILDQNQFSERQRYELARFLIKGGNVVVCEQKYRFQYRPGPEGTVTATPTKVEGNVDELLRPYGLGLKSDILMDQHSEMINVQVPKKIGGLFQAMVTTPVKFPIQIHVSPENMNSSNPITNRISSLFYIWGSSLELDAGKIKEAGLQQHTVFSSSAETWLIPYKAGTFNEDQLDRFKNEMKGPQPLAVAVSGMFPDPFKGKPVPAWSEEEKPKSGAPAEADLPHEPKPGTLMVIGCADMFSNRGLGAMQNGLFMVNAVDSLTLGNDLISIRSKIQPSRSIREVSAGQRIFYRFFTTGLAPLILVIIGATRLMIRRRRREQYLRMVTNEA